jgi:hypothetical protein
MKKVFPVIKIISSCCLFIVGINQLCIGQKTESATRVFPVNLGYDFPSSGYSYSKTIANTKMSELKDAREKQLLPINGKIEFLTSCQRYGYYSFLVRADNAGAYFIDIRHLPNKSTISEKDTIAPFCTQKISSQLVDELFNVFTFLIENFKSKEVSIVSFDGTEVVFRCFREYDYWSFTVYNPLGGEFVDLTNICYGIIRDCSNCTFDEKKCMEQLESLKKEYTK